MTGVCPTVAVHVNDPDGFDVYAGRPTHRHPHPAVKAGSPFANRYVIGVDGDRPTVIAMFRLWLIETHEGERLLHRARIELPGRRIACWCARPGRPITAVDPLICHAQLLAAAADGRPMPLTPARSPPPGLPAPPAPDTAQTLF